MFDIFARVAKLADALDSGSSGRKVVQVRVLSRAQGTGMNRGGFIKRFAVVLIFSIAV